MAGPITETEGAVFNPDILHRLVIQYRMPQMVARNIADTRFEDVKVGDNIDVAQVSRLSANTVTLGTAFKTISYENPTESKVTISINTWVYAAFALEQYEEAVAAKDLEAIYRQSAIDGVLVKIDADLLAAADSFTQTVGTDGTTLTDDNILTARAYLDSQNVPPTDRHLVFHPDQYAEFMKLDRWTSELYRGFTPINDYNVQRVYGFNVWSTTQTKAGVSGHVNFACHKEALGLVVRKEPAAWTLQDPDTLSTKVVYPAVYGTAVMRDDHGHELLGK